jgi:hypothetical protein
MRKRRRRRGSKMKSHHMSESPLKGKEKEGR